MLMTANSFIYHRCLHYILLCLLSLGTVVYCNENSPEMLMTRRVLSTLPQIPNVIKSHLEGKPDGIREMVTTVLGDGLLSKLVVSPIKALEMTNNKNKDSTSVKPTDLDSNSIIAPNTLDVPKPRSDRQEKPKNVETRKEKTNLAELLLNGEEQLFVDGRPVKSEETVLKAYELNRNPNEPEKLLRNFHDNDRTKQLPGETAEIIMRLKKNSTTRTTPAGIYGFPTLSTPPPQAVAETLLTALKQFFGNDEASKAKTGAESPITQPIPAQTVNPITPLSGEPATGPIVPPLPMSAAFGSRTGAVDFTKIDPSRLQEIYSLMGVSPQPEYLGSASNVRRSDLKSSIDALLLSLRSRDISELSINEVKSLQGYLQSYEQNLQTKELLHARQKLQMIQAQLDEQKMRIQEQKLQEEQLQMQAARLEEQRRRMEEQVQRQLYTWHGAFKTLNAPEILPLSTSEPINNKLYDGIRRAPERDAAFLIDKKPLLQNFARDEKPLEKVNNEDTTTVSNIRMTSSLERQLRYAPNNKQQPTSTFRGFPTNQTAVDCACEDVNIAKLSGSWLQTLSSRALLKSLYSAVASIFDETEAVELSCSDLKISAKNGINKEQQASYVWTFRTVNSDRIFRISGNIAKGSNAVLLISGANFSGQEFYFPVCILKAGIGDTDEYEYITAVNSNDGCGSATLLVRNPENFFNEPDVSLIKYLRKKISNLEMDEMDVVPHGKSCTV